MKELKNINGDVVPYIGMGTFPLQGQKLAEIVKCAVKVGYRIIDTADDYKGESGIGDALKELESDGICKREDLFIQTKLSDNAAHSDEPLAGLYFSNYSRFMKRHTVDEIVREKVDNSLRELKTEYIDSLLIHLPYPNYYEEIWETMISIQKEGKIRYLGVSNFHERHIEALRKYGVIPAINEIYISPIGTKEEQVDYNNNNGIQLMAYSPLKDIAHKRINLDKIQPIMDKYQKSLAQVILRWNIERGCIPLPMTKTPKRLEENFKVFDFSMTDDEVKTISSLNEDYQYLTESKICPGL